MREFTRVPIKIKARIKSGDTIINSDETRDISLKGVFVCCKDPLPEGSSCEATLLLYESETPLEVTLKGNVGRVEENGMGVEFTEIGLEDYTHLKNIVMLNSTNSDEVEKEIKSHLGIKRKQ